MEDINIEKYKGINWFDESKSNVNVWHDLSLFLELLLTMVIYLL